MQTFDPLSALIGGALIGLGAALLVVFNGRVAGVSGILGGLLDGERANLAWRAAFVIGLAAAALLSLNLTAATVEIAAGWPLIVAGGLLVGAGSRLGSGCTSGHGVCGMARGSGRSITATLVYFSVAAATVFATRHLMGG
ncbi:MAG: YeeE/YedE family protein [Rhodospirillales bacterium CG15_BIG_FIL_POST_REV_8_21_14_020_66_15]|nr:MAG: YeeE/YedE family protein [Rhodospirillales bacterium CG15_BIG_FIL_POST_REV_8_21_14_020_66_15]